MSEMKFSDFSAINRLRCESPKPQGFEEKLGSEDYGAEYFAMSAFSEMGEVCDALLGATGKKARKKHLTREDILDEIGDVTACLDLLAQSLGSNLGECARIKFNKVSDRIGSNLKI